MSETREEGRQYCTFYLDEFLFGVEVERVQEVIRYQEMTRVPLAPPVISGLINLRGQIVTAIDLRRRLDLPPRAGEAQSISNMAKRPKRSPSPISRTSSPYRSNGCPRSALSTPPAPTPLSVPTS